MGAIRLEALGPHLQMLRDICNVYVVWSVSGRCLCIDSGSGLIETVLDAQGLPQPDWVLHTHCHRDQCEGDLALRKRGTLVAAPRAEAQYLTSPIPADEPLYDCFDVGRFSMRPRTRVDVARVLDDYDSFVWEEFEFRTLPTPGPTPGAVTLMCAIDGREWAFTGDLIADHGRVWSLYDAEWTYMGNEGLNVWMHSVASLKEQRVQVVAPSHGVILDHPASGLETLESNLGDLYDHLGDWYLAAASYPKRSQVTPRIERLSAHLLAVTSTCANSYAIIDDDGVALLFDFGFPTADHFIAGGARLTKHTLEFLERDFGLTRIDVVVPTHYHGDHVGGIGQVMTTYGSQLWAHESFSDMLTEPAAFRLPCLSGTPRTVHRVLRENEQFSWRRWSITARHFPGHTSHHAAFFSTIDDRNVAITGDGVVLSATAEIRGGGPAYWNGVSATDFSRSASTLAEFAPDVLLTGHNGAITVTDDLVSDFATWADRIEGIWRELAVFADAVDFSLNPHLATVSPAWTQVEAGKSCVLRLIVRNFSERTRQDVVLVPAAPEGWAIAPPRWAGSCCPRGEVIADFTLAVPPEATASTRQVVAFDVTIGSLRLGSAADCVVAVDP